MPIHDWCRVDPGVFHDFHQAWTIEIRNALNGGLLPPGFVAMAEQIVSGPIPDVVTLKRRGTPAGPPHPGAGVAVAVGDPLPGLPIFLNPDTYVPAPLETTYEATWAKCPDALREAVESPA